MSKKIFTIGGVLHLSFEEDSLFDHHYMITGIDAQNNALEFSSALSLGGHGVIKIRDSKDLKDTEFRCTTIDSNGDDKTQPAWVQHPHKKCLAQMTWSEFVAAIREAAQYSRDPSDSLAITTTKPLRLSFDSEEDGHPIETTVLSVDAGKGRVVIVDPEGGGMGIISGLSEEINDPSQSFGYAVCHSSDGSISSRKEVWIDFD